MQFEQLTGGIMSASAPAPPSAPTGYVATAPQMKNGLGIAALCCGLVGILVGLIPLMFIASGALGILAITFGFIGFRRARRGEASNRGVAIAGLATGVAAFALCIVGIVIVMSGLNTLSNDLDQISTGAAPASAVHTATYQEAHLIHQGLFLGNS